MNIRNMSVDELRELSASLFVYRRQLDAEINRHVEAAEALAREAAANATEAERLREIRSALDDSEVIAERELKAELDPDEYTLGDLKALANGNRIYSVIDSEGHRVGSIVGRGRAWASKVGNRRVGSGSSKQAALEAVVAAL